MYLWRRSASQEWWSDHGQQLRNVAGERVAIIERPDRKRLRLEIASESRNELEKLAKDFGGRIEQFPRDWLKRFLYHQTRSLRIASARLIIPAGAAFGTGEHATTAMSLRLLEKVTRGWKTGWAIVDLGTGNGNLAPAARPLGAEHAIGIDNDPIAISTAKQNARLNKIRSAQLQAGEIRHWKLPPKVDIITANLFSELLIEILPKLKPARWLVLSGILRNQEREVTRALRRNKIRVMQLRRHGKWVAILARCAHRTCRRN